MTATDPAEALAGFLRAATGYASVDVGALALPADAARPARIEVDTGFPLDNEKRLGALLRGEEVKA